MADDARDRSIEHWREIYRTTQAAGSQDCPGAEDLAALVIGELAGADRTALADHIVSCRSCSARHRDLLDLHRNARATAPVATPTVRATGRDGSRARWIFGAAAAAILLAIGLPVALRSISPATGRAAAERGIDPFGKRVTPADGTELTAPPRRLEWPAIDGGTGYRTVLYDFESTPIWDSPEVEGTTVDLPRDVQRRLQAAGPYYWRVSYRVGLEWRQSGLFSFTVQP